MELYSSAKEALSGGASVEHKGSLFNDLLEFYRLACRLEILTDEERERYAELRDNFKHIGV